MDSGNERLAVIMPVYNEEEAVGQVLDRWCAALDFLGIDYTIHPYNDGSRDGSLAVLRERAARRPDRITVHDKPNGGHGPTVLQGYREAAAAGYGWIFQIDSDDEMGPESFGELWNRRGNYDFLAGIRNGRRQPLPRKAISAVSRLSVRLLYGRSISDVNVPYRLMRVSAFRELFETVPGDTFAPNVILTGMAARKRLRIFETRVPQRERQTGEVSIRKWKLLRAALLSFLQTFCYACVHPSRGFAWAAILAVTLLSGAMTDLFPLMRPGQAGTDSSVFVTVARMIDGGKVLYRDVFDHKGPVIYAVDFIGLKLGGLRGVGLLELAAIFLAAWLTFQALAVAVSRSVALIALLLFPFTFFHCIEGGNLVEEFALPAIAYGNWFLVNAVVRKRVSFGGVLLLGAAAALVALLRLNMLSVFVVACFAVAYCGMLRKSFGFLVKSGIGFLAGAAIVVVPVILYFAHHHALGDFLYANLGFNLSYAGSSSFPEKVISLLKRIDIAYFFLPIAFALLLLASERNRRELAVFLLAEAGITAFVTLGNATYYGHYALVTIPLLLISGGVLLQEYVQWNRHRILACLALLLFWDVCLAGKGVYRKLKPERDPDLPRLAETMRRFPDAGNRLLVLGNDCMVYSALGVVPEAKYIYQLPLVFHSNRVREELRAMFASRACRAVIVVRPKFDEKLLNQLGLAADYEKAAEAGRYDVWVPRSTPNQEE